MIDLHLSAFAPRWRFLYVVRIDAYPACAQGSLTIVGNVAAGDFRNCVPPVPLRHFYAISAWGCVGK